MPYIIGGRISSELPGLWAEGPPYASSLIYDIADNSPGSPPVNYCAHTLKPHSLTHFDAEGHIVQGGRTIEQYFAVGELERFWGPAVVLRLEDARWERSLSNPGLYVWRVERPEIEQALVRVTGSSTIPEKLLITPAQAPLTPGRFHDPNYVFVLSGAAAVWLAAEPRFHLFGTSWKSCDFEPGSRERPVHRALLKRALLLEYVVLADVPEGCYMLCAFPLEISGATESPVNPVLFTPAEWPSTRL